MPSRLIRTNLKIHAVVEALILLTTCITNSMPCSRVGTSYGLFCILFMPVNSINHVMRSKRISVLHYFCTDVNSPTILLPVMLRIDHTRLTGTAVSKTQNMAPKETPLSRYNRIFERPGTMKDHIQDCQSIQKCHIGRFVTVI
jgi:hypothetical protein